jgi:hypothetical protein
MDTKTRNIVVIVVGVVLSVAALVGVIFGVTTHTEPGLMSVCWNLDGTADYSHPCANPSDLRWENSRIPLVVDGPAESSELREAVSIVNDQIGCQVLRLSPGAGLTADVNVALDQPALVGVDNEGGSCRHLRGASGRMFAVVETINVTDPTSKTRVLVHEFGHALGLAHDPFESSIMYPTQPAQGSDPDFIRFTDSDMHMLHDMYCVQH